MGELRKFKAEAFDIMQYFYGSVHEPLIHSLIEFSGHIDEMVLKKAVSVSTDINPLIRCYFDINHKYPYWKEKDFKGEDFVKVIACSSNEEEQKIKLLASKIDALNGPQLKIYVIRKQDSDILCIIINHMLCDGAGFKEYLYELSDLYTKCKKNIEIPKRELASRSINQLFKNIKWHEKLNILFSKSELSKQKNEVRYSLEGAKGNPLFITIDITSEELEIIKAYGKLNGATVNDIIITAYVRALYRKTGNERIVIPCPIDLRKYLSVEEEHGICNLTSNYICDVIMDNNKSFADTLMDVSKQMKLQKSNNNCLKPVILLECFFNVLPFNLMKKLFDKVFTIPVVSYTNLGVIDKKQLNFDNIEISHIYLTGAIKHVPYFQIAVSTYNGVCTISSNLFGSENDKKNIIYFLNEMKKELKELNKSLYKVESEKD